MIKEVLTNIFIFAAFAAGISALSACGGGSQTTSSGMNAPGTNASNSTTKRSAYPPLLEKVAQADMKHLDGSSSKVADRKGKVLLLNMWATWCGPCRAEMPELVKLQDQYREQGFEIIGLNTDDGDTPEMVTDFAKEMSLNYTLVWATMDMQKELLKISKYQGIPQSFLIDREGNLRGVFKGASHVEIQKMKTTVAKVMAGEDSGSDVMPDADANSKSAPSNAAPATSDKKDVDAKKGGK